MSDINVTPLVDVMLVLLIIFMVATPMLEKERRKQELQENRDKQQRLVALNLPILDERKAPPPEDLQDVATVTMKISSDLKVQLDKASVSDCSAAVGVVDKSKWSPCFDKIEAELLDNKKAKEFGVTVDASPSVPFGFVVGVIHRLHRVGVTKVGMMPRVAEAPSE